MQDIYLSIYNRCPQVFLPVRFTAQKSHFCGKVFFPLTSLSHTFSVLEIWYQLLVIGCRQNILLTWRENAAFSELRANFQSFDVHPRGGNT
jgi:hypothetical protein